MKQFCSLIVISVLLQVLCAASIEDKYEPMVAFNCGMPAMYRGVSGWKADKTTDCLNTMEDILVYCKAMYPDHNITNVVESSRMMTIPDWPLLKAGRQLTLRVRPFRCLVGGFQSDALLVPQHCEFDHRHDQALCEGFSHWNIVADDACRKKGSHLESFGMLLNCKLGKFSGVEYVCCPNETETNYHPPQSDDKPDNWQNDSEEEDDDDYDEDSEEEIDTKGDKSSSEDDENTVDLYEAYLRGKEFPLRYSNEHKKFLAAKERMKKNQQHKVKKLLQEWQVARDHVNDVRKSDPKTADIMAKEITERFQNLYAAYEKEDTAEKDQLVALHQQHVQAALNEKKREAMDKYMRALEKGDTVKITKYLRGYIKAEERDRMHTVNHFEHVKYSAPHEAVRIQPYIVKHLKVTEERIDQAMEMLKHYPEVEAVVRPEVEEFLKRFDSIANSIRDVILPELKLDQEQTSISQAADVGKGFGNQNKDGGDDISIDESTGDLNINIDEPEEAQKGIGHEIGHEYERKNNFVAHRMQDIHHVQQGGIAEAAASSSQVGSTIGIALGSVSVFVIVVVAIMMLKHNKSRQSVSHGYIEVNPSASPEERHLANMQMNGYENPTYKYFEVAHNPKA